MTTVSFAGVGGGIHLDVGVGTVSFDGPFVCFVDRARVCAVRAPQNYTHPFLYKVYFTHVSLAPMGPK